MLVHPRGPLFQNKPRGHPASGHHNNSYRSLRARTAQSVLIWFDTLQFDETLWPALRVEHSRRKASPLFHQSVGSPHPDGLSITQSVAPASHHMYTHGPADSSSKLLNGRSRGEAARRCFSNPVACITPLWPGWCFDVKSFDDRSTEVLGVVSRLWTAEIIPHPSDMSVKSMQSVSPPCGSTI